MTLDLTVAPPFVASTERRQIAQYTGPATYAAGGDPITPNDVRMGKIFAVLGGLITNGTLVRLVTYIPATEKLFITVPDTGAEASGDLSTYSGRLEFVGQ
jgi:hypothetical protein